MFLKVLGTFFFVLGLIVLLFSAINLADTPRLAIKVGFSGLFLWVMAILLISVAAGARSNTGRLNSSRH